MTHVIRCLPIAAALMLATSPVSAAIRVGAMDLGIRVGANASTITEFLDLAEDRIYSLNAGVVGAYGVSEWVAVEVGVGYSGKGGETGGVDASANPSTFTTKLGYLAVPVRARLPLGPGPVMPYFAFGGELAFLLSAEQGFESDPGGLSDVKDDFNGFDFSSIVGIGVEIPVRRVLLVIEGGWTRGFTDVPDVAGVEGKNGTVHVVAGITWRRK
jgi:hypothetical protein